jgi:hypothetical protein
MIKNYKDLIGNKYGRLTVNDFAGMSKSGHAIYKCVCVCGKEKNVQRASLIKNRTKSCGCLRIEATVARTTKHGLSGLDAFVTWDGMMQRCHNKKNPVFKYYGGRGIEVCCEWRDVKKFIDWATINGYEKGLHIDRIDNDKGYSPENCRFVTPAENSAIGRKRKQTNNTSGCVGVSKLKNQNVWESSIKINNKKIHIGRFKTLKDAAIARIIKEIELFGEQKTNFHFITKEGLCYED